MQYLRISAGTAKYLFCQAFSRDSAPPLLNATKYIFFLQTYCFFFFQNMLQVCQSWSEHGCKMFKQQKSTECFLKRWVQNLQGWRRKTFLAKASFYLLLFDILTCQEINGKLRFLDGCRQIGPGQSGPNVELWPVNFEFWMDFHFGGWVVGVSEWVGRSRFLR